MSVSELDISEKGLVEELFNKIQVNRYVCMMFNFFARMQILSSLYLGNAGILERK